MDKEKAGLIARAVTQVIVAIIGVVAIFKADIPVIDENLITQILSAIIYVGVLGWNHWKNNNYTDAAKEGQKVTDRIKAESKIGRR